MITATHTHSGPSTSSNPSNAADPAVPKPDPNYLQLLEDGIVSAAVSATENAADADAGLAIADATGIGTNRRDPQGPADLHVPVFSVRNAKDRNPIALMLIACMHPTVMHEDSTLVSGDFPGLAREYLQREKLGRDVPVLHHTGPSGNQSPRHVTKANTFEEAERLGAILGSAVTDALKRIEYHDDLKLECTRKTFEPIRREFPSVPDAKAHLERAVARLDELRDSNAEKQKVRTAECDWFGAEETLTLAKAAADGSLKHVYDEVTPAEIQVFTIGEWRFIAWPGECFTEYALKVKARQNNAFIISLANGVLHGYVVTRQAVEEGGYEASNAIFSHETGQQLVKTTLDMMG